MVSVEEITTGGIEVIQRVKLTGTRSPLKLKVVSEGIHVNFYFATENDQWVAVVKDVNAHHLSAANSFGYTDKHGIYATKNGINEFPNRQEWRSFAGGVI